MTLLCLRAPTTHDSNRLDGMEAAKMSSSRHNSKKMIEIIASSGGATYGLESVGAAPIGAKSIGGHFSKLIVKRFKATKV